MTRENKVGGRFKAACRAVGIGTDAARRLLNNYLTAVFTLGNNLVAGGEIGYDLRTRKAEQSARGQGCPEILTDLEADLNAAEVKHGAADRYGVALAAYAELGRGYRLGSAVRRVKPSLLIEFAVIRDKGLGHNADDPAAEENDGAVIERATHNNGGADRKGNAASGALRGKRVKRRLDPIPEGSLSEEIGAGVAGQPQLGENKQIDLFIGGAADIIHGALRIQLHIRHLNVGDGAGYSEIIKHIMTSFGSLIFYGWTGTG